MKKLFLLFPMFFVSLSFNAQSLKTYNGTEYVNFGSGEVTYTYYLDENGQEIKHGSYSFKETETFSNPVGSQTGNLSGRYENGKQTGIWTYTYNDIDAPIDNNTYRTSTRVIKQSYKDGVPDGEWTFSISGKTRKQNVNMRTRTVSWSGFEAIKSGEAKISWKNGILVGDFKINHLMTNITGKLNSDGYLVGKWKVDNDDTEYTEQGVLKHMTNRRYGDIYTKSFDKELDLYNTSLSLQEEEQRIFLRNNKLKVSEVSTSKLKKEIKSIFDNKVFSPEVGEYILDNKSLIFGRYIELEFIEQKPLHIILGSFGSLSRVGNVDILINILNNHEAELSDTDIIAVKNRINELETEKQKREEETRIAKEKEELKKEEVRLAKEREEELEKLKSTIIEDFLKSYNTLSYKDKLKNHDNVSDYLKEYSGELSDKDKSELIIQMQYIIAIDIFAKYNIYGSSPKNAKVSYYTECLQKRRSAKFTNNEMKIIRNTASNLGIQML